MTCMGPTQFPSASPFFFHIITQSPRSWKPRCGRLRCTIALRSVWSLSISAKAFRAASRVAKSCRKSSSIWQVWQCCCMSGHCWVLKWLNLGPLPLDQTLTFLVDTPYAYSTDFWCWWHGLRLPTVPHRIELVVHDRSYWASIVGFRHGVQFWSFANGLRQHMCDTWHCVSARIVQILHCSIQCQSRHAAIQGVRPSWTIRKSRLCMHRQWSVLGKQLRYGTACSGQASGKNGIDPHSYLSSLFHP